MTQAQTQQSGDSKFRLMEEEMNRFEAEIAHHQTVQLEATTADTTVSAATATVPLVGITFATPQPTMVMPNTYLQSMPVAQTAISSHLYPTLAMPPVQQPMYINPPIITYQPSAMMPTNYYGTTSSILSMTSSQPPPMPQQHHTSFHRTPAVSQPNNSSVHTSSTSSATSESSASTVIVAAPQMAGPTELAARAKETAAAHSKLARAKPAGQPSPQPVSHQTDHAEDGEVDDDVTRALLAAAAGVTYTRVQGHSGKAKVVTSATKTPPTPVVTATTANNSSKTTSTSNSLLANSQYQQQQHQTVLHPNLLTSSPAALAAIMSVPPPTYRAVSATTTTSGSSSSGGTGGKKQKKYLRIAAGTVWEDPTLADWDPNDFRIFCGDLGYEVSDDTLARAFNRYPSFQKARIVRDKRTTKSRGYGFVSFSDPMDFTRAMREMNGKYVGNRPIKLKRSDWRIRQLETHKKKEKEKKKLGLKN